MNLRYLIAAGIIAVFSVAQTASAAPRGDFVELVKKFSPTVVDVSASGGKVKGNVNSQIPKGLPENHPFRKFFEDKGKKSKPNKARSLGSGFIIDPKGVVITNHHVIKGANEIKINLSNGQKFKAKLIGSDPYSDIAVLQIESPTKLNLPFVKFADPESVQVGQWVFAIGTPFGLRGTVTAGIVSAVNRDINAGAYDDFIQTDAAINRGNSGGPLFNIKGEVIGINTIIVSPSGGSAGAGFAIPASTALPVINQLRKSGKTSRGWLGVQIQGITEDLAATLGLSSTEGALVAEVFPNSPANKGGLKQGDVIIAFNGKPVKGVRDLPKLVSSTPVGQLAKVSVIRNSRKRDFQVLLGRLEDAMAKRNPASKNSKSSSKSKAKFGLSLKKLTPTLRARFNVPKEIKGVWVAAVDSNSSAASSGLSSNSIILEIAQRKVRSPDDVYNKIKQAKRAKKKAILIRIWQNGNIRFLPFSIE